MKTIELKISETIYNKLISFLELLPKESIQIIVKDDERSDIPFVDDEEQKEIEEILKNPECHDFESSKILKL
ncbi:MAG: hypothetical protein KJ666_11355 [Bacteroidetes bacterium]|nr:hypothetical protein [Bacteroidota bacterium]MBU2584528.1 hypothetical protein [Bacteroidota bacterium]